MPIIKTVHLVETQKTKNEIKRCATRYLILPSNKLLNSQTRIELMRILCSVCIIRVLDFMKFIFCCSLNFFRYYLKYERITKRRDKAFVIVHFPIPFRTFRSSFGNLFNRNKSSKVIFVISHFVSPTFHSDNLNAIKNAKTSFFSIQFIH